MIVIKLWILWIDAILVLLNMVKLNNNDSKNDDEYTECLKMTTWGMMIPTWYITHMAICNPTTKEYFVIKFWSEGTNLVNSVLYTQLF
jgi:hypothetical protein